MKNAVKTLKRAGAMLLAAVLVFSGQVVTPQAAYTIAESTAYAEEAPAANGSATNEMDGSKIEGIDIHWITPDSVEANNGTATPQEVLDSDADLFLATTSEADLQMKFQIEVSFSGQYDYAPGDIQITIPAQVWHARQYAGEGEARHGEINPDRLIGGMDLSVPQAPSTRADFNWQLIDGNYVMINTKTIGATSKAMFQFTITDLTPDLIVDMSKCDPITAHCEVVTNKGNIIELTSPEIVAQIDTLAVINATKKEGELYEALPDELPAGLLANLPAEDQNPDNYIFVRWYSNKRHTANQHFKLDIEDTLGPAYMLDENGDEVFVTKGIFLGSSSCTGTITPNEQGAEFDAGIHDYKRSPSSSGSFDTTVIMWSAYKKADFAVPDGRDAQAVYYMKNAIDWILTEADEDANGEDAADGQKVTRVSDEAVVTYAPIEFDKPTGHFEVFKWTEQRPNEDWLYGYGLNQLLKGEDVSMRYHLLTRGFGYPWTSVRTNPDDPNFIGEELPTQEDFGYLGWRQTVEDFQTFFNFSTDVLTSRDFEITYYEVTTPIKYRYQKVTVPTKGYMPAQNSITSTHIVYGIIPAGHFGYIPDASLPNPDLQIEYQLNGEGNWIHAATATWGPSGTEVMTFVDVADGITVDESSRRVYLPENVTDVRHIFVSNVFAGKCAEHCDTAAIDWDTYLGIDLKASEEIVAIAEQLFEQSDTPSTKFKNDVQMEVDGWIYANDDGTPNAGTRLAHGPESFFDTSRATIAGAGYGATLGKTISFNPDSIDQGGDNDVENRRAILHYKSTLKEESNLRSREQYDAAVADNIVVPETQGIWYDLLPENVSPIMSSLKTSQGETITAKYTIPDFRDTGRTLLVVETDMTPDVSSNGFYYDSAWISFDAFIGWDDIDDLGTNAVNYIAFESRSPNLNGGVLGSIKGRQGEPDDPLGGMNDFTPSMPENILNALTGLNPDTGDDSRFLYAKVDVNLNVNTAAVSGIAKAVSDDLVGNWTQGLEGQEQVVVYEGHNYSYRLRVASSESTTTRNMIIYDTIENYHIPDPANAEIQDATKEADYLDKESKKNWQGDWEGVGQWRGTLRSVDLYDFVQADVAPVLYYSLIPDLSFADSTIDMSQDEKLELFNSGAYDITNASIWQKAELDGNGQWIVPESLVGKISAVAIDARKDVNGEDFLLLPGEALSGYLRMVAPDDNSDPDVWHAKGAYAHKTDDAGNPIQEIDWEAATDYKNNMFAFNNTRLKCVQSGEDAGGESSDIMIRNDYTRVGILPGVIGVKKVWDDDDNWDNKRPEEITVTLQRKTAGQGGSYEPVTGADGQPLTVTLSDDNDWQAFFLQIDLVDEENNQYLFSFDEGEIEGYTGTVSQLSATSYQLLNVHEKEKVRIKGEKQWRDSDNAAGQRPEAIRVTLLRDGEAIETLVVNADSKGNWYYDFGPQDKYAMGGVEHVYEVEEEYVAKYVSESDGYALLVNDYIPYGDLSVLKKLENATEAARAKDFEFTIELYAEMTQEQIDAGEAPKPLLDNYDYEIFELADDGETWNSVSTGTLTCSSTFVLKGDQKILISQLPSESTYTITETESDGFSLSGKVNDKGTIRAGQLTEAEFTNTYSTSGSVQLNAGKTLTGRGMNKNQHKFQIIDMNESSATYGEAIRTAYSGTPTNTQEELGKAIEAEAIAAFGQLTFANEDDGKIFYYQVVEVNAGKPGYTYDARVINVTVTVKDNGDGTMTVTAVDSDTGADLTAADGSGMTFENGYDAYGEIVLKAWKVMNRRDLVDGEFSFELYRYNTATGAAVGGPIQTVANDGDGNIIFESIAFDQDDVSLDEDNPARYAYLVKEVVGNDETVIYSTEKYIYLVTVHDNGDGTLSFDEAVTTPEGDSAVPVFTNDLKPGGLAVKKVAEKGANSPFTFKVKLTGEGLPEYVSGELDGAQVTAAPTNTPEPTATPEPAKTPEPYVARTPAPAKDIDVPEWVYPKGEVYHASESDLQGHAYAMLDQTTGKLTIFRSDEGDPTAPDGKSFDLNGSERIEDTANNRVYFDLDETRSSAPAWTDDDKTAVTAVEVADPYKPNTIRAMFSGFVNMTEADLGKMDTSLCRDFFDVFCQCESLAALDVSTFDTSNVTSMQGTFNKCTSLGMLDLSNWDTSKVTNFYWTFKYCGALKRLDVSTWDTSSATNMGNMFGDCKSLQTLDLSSFDNSKVREVSFMFVRCNTLQELKLSDKFTCESATTMESMFEECSSLLALDVSMFQTDLVTSFLRMFHSCSNLTELDVSDWNTESAQAMNSMFAYCKCLTTLDVSGFDTSGVGNFINTFYCCSSLAEINVENWDTSNATSMHGMFDGCYVLKQLDVSNFNTSNVTSFAYMFAYCHSLPALDVSNFDTSKATELQYMFEACESVESLDVSNFDTSLCTNMNAMFNSCYRLTSLDLSSFDTSAVLNMYAMFSGCESLTSINLSSFDTSKVTNMGFMFQRCSSLETLDLSNFYTPTSPQVDRMFANCSNLVELDIRNMTVRSAEMDSSDYGYMFSGTKLEKISIGNEFMISGTGYGNAIPDARHDKPYSGKWENEDDASEIYGDILFMEGGHAGTWILHKSLYKLNFDPGDGAGSMASAEAWTGGDYTFLPTFYYNGYFLTGFADEDGNSFTVDSSGNVTIPAYTYEDGDEVTLTAQWEERDMTLALTNGEFTFSIFPGETITFNDLPAGTKYEVYEETPEGWTLVKQENVAGMIKPVEIANASFENAQDVTEINLYPIASKLLDNEPAKEGAFIFELVDPDGNVVETITNGEGGVIAFQPLTFTIDDLDTSSYKYLYYRINEVAGSDDTIKYDTTYWRVRIYLSKDSSGNLKASMSYHKNGSYSSSKYAVFSNTTKPGGFEFSKQISGDLTYMASQQPFNFQITFTDEKLRPWTGDADNDVKVYRNGSSSYSWQKVSSEGIVTISLIGNQRVRFADIPAGIRYEIKEIGELPGWKMDDTVVNGKIVPNESPMHTFSNEYHAEGSASPAALKQMVGRKLKDGEFTFQLVEASYDAYTNSYTTGDVIATATNTADGMITFEPITYTEEGYYYYVIREVPGEDENVEYTTDEILMCVWVQDTEGKGVLSTQQAYWENKYFLANELKKGELQISKTVVSTYEPHAGQEFTFTVYLSDADGNPVSGQVTLDNGSKLTFTDGAATFALKDGQSVTLKDLPAGTSYQVLEAEASGFTTTSTGASGKIKPEATAKADFTNTYAAKGEYVPTVSKKLAGLDLTINQFSFQLLDENDYVVETVSNDENGKAEFTRMLFSHNDVGTRVFSVKEVSGGAAGITYDKTICTVTLTISDNGDGTMTITDDLNGEPITFENTYSDKTEFSVSKVWNDGEDLMGLRPDAITVKLLQNRVEYDSVELNADNEWAHTFTELPAFDEDGVSYLYEAEEVPVQGYTTSMTQSETEATFTNTVMGMMKVNKIVEKGSVKQLFDFIVMLKDKAGEPLTGDFRAVTADGETTVTADENGAVTFQLSHGQTFTMYDLPIGTNYSVAEEDVPGYTATVTQGVAEGRIQRLEENAVTITNVGDLAVFTATKQWEGGSGPIELTLYANGEKMDPQPACVRDGDVYTFSDLLRFDEEGEEIEYSAKEKYFDGYVTIYKNTGAYENVSDAVYDGGTIINRKIKEADFQIRKVWSGLDEDESKPEITLVLYCNGEKLDVPTPKANSNGWYRYYDLPDHYNGVPAVYTVQEEPLDGFITSYQLSSGESADYADHGGTITNARIPATGDAGHLAIWLSLLTMSAACLGMLFISRKRKQH